MPTGVLLGPQVTLMDWLVIERPATTAQLATMSFSVERTFISKITPAIVKTKIQVPT
jgi:hypothetical protein